MNFLLLLNTEFLVSLIFPWYIVFFPRWLPEYLTFVLVTSPGNSTFSKNKLASYVKGSLSHHHTKAPPCIQNLITHSINWPTIFGFPPSGNLPLPSPHTIQQE